MNESWVNPIFNCKAWAPVNSWFIFPSNFSNSFPSQFGIAVFFSPSCPSPSLLIHIPHVLHVGSRLQVIGPDALRVIANDVEQVEAGGNRTIGKFPAYTVS